MEKEKAITTCHSDYGVIKSLVLKPANEAFESQNKIDSEWKKLNYLDAVHFEKAKTEYQDFQRHFEQLDAALHLLPPAPTSMDSIYCRDASLATDYGLILCNMGKEERKKEPSALKEYCQSNDIQILGQIEAPGTAEGGDMCWLDPKTLAIGHTYRTNAAGIEQIKGLLEPHGIEVMTVDLPHYKGVEDVFHLMSIISPIDKDLAVVYSPLMPIGFRNELIKKGYSFVECPDEEFETMGCNVLALAPRKVLMVEGNPITEKRLKSAGCEVLLYQGNDISQKGCGGPTCLTRPLKRLI